jgi:CubicO group peptidase (beta-lactamase class C family)
MTRHAHLLLCALIALVAGAASAQPAPATVPAVEPAAATAANDPEAAALLAAERDAAAAAAARAAEALAAWTEGAVAALRQRAHIAGVVVAVVRDGEVLLVRGFGHDRIDPPRAADGERSLFRIGSVSKTFTYVAAMQLVEQARIALEDPVNQHLPEALQLPDDGFTEPVRVRHLFSHTAGFEDSALGHLFERDPADVLAPEAYLVQHRPRRVRAPDTTAVYSNYSVALLGAVVAHVSGMPFEAYIERHVTGPLGMDRTTFREPLAEGDPRRLEPRLAQDIATGYRWSNGAFQAGEFEFIAHGAPAGGASASAADMARWMLVHLGEGTLDGARILSPESALAMRGILFRNAPDVAGIAHGFLTQQFGPHFAYGHGGATLYFHTGMVMLPELGLGVFVSANGAEARAPVRELVQLLVERLVPDAVAAEPVAAPAVDAGQLQRFAGSYRNNRRAHTRAEMAINPGDTEVVAADDGTLRIRLGSDWLRVAPTGPLSFKEPQGNTRVQFTADERGGITGFAYGQGIAGFDRIGWLQRQSTLFALLAAVAGLAVVRLWRSWRRHRRNPPRPGLFPVKALGMANAVVWLGAIALGAVALLGMAGEGTQAVFTYPSGAWWWTLALVTVAAALTAMELLALPAVWRSGWRAGPKLRNTLAVALLASTVYVLWTWNLVGLRP